MGLIKLHGDALSWATILSCSFAMLLFGYDQGVMSGLISADNFKMRIFGTLNPSASISGLVVAIYEIGAFVGSIGCMFYGQTLGRRRTVMLGQTITVIGAGLQSSAFSLGHMIAARVITGIGMGHITSTVPVWSAEIARASYRGKAAVALLLAAVLGLVIAYWTDYGASFYDSDFSFRFPLALQILFSLGQVFTIPFLPESPRWLLARGREADAIDVILAICDAKTIEEDAEASTLLGDIRLAVELENDGKSALREMFTWGPLQYFRRILLAFGAQAMQQLTGICVIAYYSTVVFKVSVGMDDRLALLVAGFVTLAFLAGTFISLFIIDRMGRRPLMLYGLACASIGMAVTAVGTSMQSRAAGIAATFGIFFFNFNYGIGFQSAPWLYGVEITPLRLRHFAGAISSASGWIWNYAVVQVTQPGIESIGYKYFIVWAVLNFTWFWVVYFFYPETARKTLEELDFIFMKPEDRPSSNTLAALKASHDMRVSTEVFEYADKMGTV